MLITQELDQLLGGVSQAHPRLRDPSQAEEQINMLSHRTRGLRKRPPTEHVAKLNSDTTDYATAFDYPIHRSATEKFRCIIVDGDLKVYDVLTGAAVSVIFPNGKDYLTGSAGFRAVTVGDSVVIVNRGVTCLKDTSTKAPDAATQAMIVVRQGDYATKYTVTLDGTTHNYTTPNASANNAKTSIGTDAIAASLNAVMQASGLLGSYTVTQYGSALHLERNDGFNFLLSVTDGLGGDGLLAIKGSVQVFTDLPTVAKAGMIVEVVGSPETEADNYFVEYDDSGTAGQAGVWREVVQPGALIDLLASSMPHVLAFGGAVLDGLTDVAIPAPPTCGAGEAAGTVKDGWSTYTGSPVIEADDQSLETHASYVAVTPTGTNGTARTVTVTYDVDTRNIDFTDSVTLDVKVAGVSVHTSTVGPNVFLTNVAQQVSIPAMAAGSEVRLTLTYGLGVTPSVDQRAYILAHGLSNAGGPGVLTQTSLAAQVVFASGVVYPAGSTVTVVLDGTNFAHLVGATDETGAAIATALQALIDASATYVATNPSSGVILITRTDGAFPASGAFTTFASTTTLWNTAAGMTAGEHVGGIIKNLTDGSQGTITANTASTVAAALTGGADNTFQPGDVCSIIGSGTYFVFKPATWTPRAAGDDASAPYPSLVDRTVDDVFFFENRLGFTAGENVILSESGNPFNVFRTSAAQLLASDVVDVKPPVRVVQHFDSALAWVDGVYLFTEQGEFFRLSGEPVLTPSTVRMDYMGQYTTSRAVRPIATDKDLVLCSVKNGYTRVAIGRRAFSAAVASSSDGVTVMDITPHVPTYLVGNPIALLADTVAQMLFVLTDGGSRRSLYVCNYAFEADPVQIAWSRWDFAPGSTLIGLDVLEGVLGLVFKRADGAHLETLTLDPSAVPDVAMLDGTITMDGTYTFSGTLV